MLKETLLNNNKTAKRPPIILFDEFEKDKTDKFVQLRGKLTSQIWTRKSTDTPYYAFLRLGDNNKHSRKVCERTKCQECEIPVIFRLFNQQKPNLDKNHPATLIGNWAKSDHSQRPSFTCYSYQRIND